MKLRKWSIEHTKGLLLGIITPLIIFPVVLWGISITQNYLFEQLWNKFKYNSDYQVKILTISIIANLGWFYYYLNKERYNIAMGLIIASIAFAPYIIYVKFF